MAVRSIYPTLQSVLDEFQAVKYKSNDDVSTLLKIYADAKENAKNVTKNHPLIVLEGLDLSGKSTISKLLAKKANAVLKKSPPTCISPELRAAFDDHAELKTAFYTLGNYIAAFEILVTLETQSVVLDRFWHSTVANALARAIQANPSDFALPARGNAVYRWPADLLKPDIVLFLRVSESERLKRHARRSARSTVTKEEILLKDDETFRQNVLLAYDFMEEPAVQQIDSNVRVKDTLALVLQAVKHLIE